jgi:Spy/CpxP family protein refolding chaperone
MRKHLRTLLVASMLAAGLAAAPAIYARGSDGAGGSMMGRGMMGQGGMMGQMSSMMENCNQMMQAMMEDGHEPARPNEQWRDRQPAPQDQPRPQAPAR